MKIKNAFSRIMLLVMATAVMGVMSVHGVDGLQIQVQQNTNIMLRWPSNPGQTYLILYTKSLNAPIQWTVLEQAYPAAEGTNETTFIHYGQIPEINDVNSLTAVITGDQESSLENSSIQEENTPLAIPSDGSGDPVPLSLYPQGFDLSNLLIYDRSASEWMPSSQFSTEPVQPLDDLGDTNSIDENLTNNCGFYKVMGVIITGGITNNSSLSDYISAISAKPEIGLKYLQLLADGERFPAQDALFPPFTNTITFENIDTSRITNGEHDIQVEAVYQIPNPNSEGLFHTLSQPFHVSISNELSFPAWDDMTEDEVCGFDIVSAHPAVDWEIDVYNVYDYISWLQGQLTNIYPIHVKTGSTTNGIIQYDWNLIDDGGNPRNDPDYDPYFVSFTYTQWSGSEQVSNDGPIPMGSSGTAMTPNPLKQQPSKWPDQGHWVVAWQDMFRHYYDEDNNLKNAFNSILSMANLEDAPPFWQGPIGGTNAQTFPIRYFYNDFRTDLNPTNADFFDSTSYDENLFQLMLRDSRARNLFYYGHGTPDFIAGSVYAPLLRDNGMHRYRFVWLDGCETGNGSWPETFGIKGPGLFSIEYYKERTKRPALFVGNKYSVPIGIPYDDETEIGGANYNGEIPQSVSQFYIQFIFYWQLIGETYKDAVENAQNLVKSAYPQPVMHYLNGPKNGQVYWPGDDQSRVGLEEMKFNQYNHSSDIPRPN